MKYKALIMDVDGTLVLNTSKSIPSEKVITAVNNASGYVYTCLATGRPLSYVQHLFSLIKITGICILDHGARIYDPEGNKFIKEAYLSNSQAENIYRIFHNNNLPIWLFTDSSGTLYQGQKMDRPIYGLWSENIPENRAKFIEKQITLIGDVSVNLSSSWEGKGLSVDVTHISATKQTGVYEIVNYLKLDTQEIIGIGDSYNDFPLLMACGLKIAMGNAVPELKEIADYIAPPVEEDGVAWAIDKFILSGKN